MITYTTTWLKGMNTRPTHSVSNSPNGTIPYGTTVNVLEVWIAPADGTNVKKDDKWARIESNIIQWVAVIHLGVIYGTLSDIPDPDPNPEPTPTPTFPESFVLTDPSGAQAEYQFVRIIE